MRTLGAATGADFTARQISALDALMRDARLLWRCRNAPLDRFAQLEQLVDGGRRLSNSHAGQAFPHTDLIAFGASARFGGRTFRHYAAHEVAHKLLQNADPRTCVNYVDAYANPLMKSYMQRVGWVGPTRLDPPRIPGSNRPELPPDAYALTNAKEDMATSFAFYLDAPASVSPRRRAFFDELFAALGAAR